MRKLTNDEFISRCKKIHGNKFDYSETNYTGDNQKVKIKCPIHGYFSQLARNHLNTYGCQLCSNKQLSLAKSNNLQDFLNKAKSIHGDEYDYSKSVYISAKTKIIVICKTHGEFLVTPDNHTHGSKCKKCSDKINNDNQIRLSKEEVLLRCKKVHGDRYTYTNMDEYKNTKQKMEIICKEHGPFYQNMNNHLFQRKGCSLCVKYSNAEIYIKRKLIESGLKFTHNKTFDDCVNDTTKRKLKFDFFIEDFKLIIEYDGIHHFKNIDYWKTHSAEKVQRRDEIKNSYCKLNNINIIRIKYDENLIDVVDQILSSLLFCA